MHLENRVQIGTSENFTLTFVNNVLVSSNETTNLVFADFRGTQHMWHIIASNFNKQRTYALYMQSNKIQEVF